MRPDSIAAEGVLYEDGFEAAPDDRPVGRELRLALAMRGGVSLAVWIGGAVSEIERLREAETSPTYEALLRANGYGSVIVDVLSGASAGGLNGVVYSAAQVFGFQMRALRDLWIDLGDIELLARATTAGERARSAPDELSWDEALRPPSLLRGDEYFYRQVRDALRRQIDTKSGTAPVADRIDLLLSATLYTPQMVKRLVNASTVIQDGRSGALFRFRHSSDHSDYGDGSTGHPGVRQLAMAARTTSSFPGAFEPAEIATGPDAAREATANLNFAGLFEVPAVSTHDTVHEVIDGGVLDNIPVTAAIDAIVDAPADGPTERWLCYLHPSPARVSEGTEDVQTSRPRGVATTLRTFATRFNQESLLEDIDELGLVNDVQMRRNLVRSSILAPFGRTDHPALRAHVDADETRRRIRSIIAQFEAHRVRSGLQRPDRLRLDPPYPLVSNWSARNQDALSTAVVADMSARYGADAPPRSLFALGERIDLLIAFARTIENQLPPDATDASDVKAELYGLRSNLDALMRKDAQVWAAAAATAFGRDGSHPDVTGWAEATATTAQNAVATEAAAIADALRDAGRSLAAADIQAPSPFSLIVAAHDSGVGAVDDTVEALVEALLPVRLVGRGPWGQISFVYITGDAPVARDLDFRGLADDGAPTAADKLCGNQLGNFAAFLSAKWRANDWLWGRMDAASTLVAALTNDALFDDPDARAELRALAGSDVGDDPEAIRDGIRLAIQNEILAAELPVVAATPTSGLDGNPGRGSLSAETLTVGRETVADLSTTRRVRVGMRMAHLAFGALRPAGDTSAAAILRRVLSALKPAYLVAVFAMLSPALATLSFAIGTAALQSTFWQGTGDVDATFDLASWALLAISLLAGGAVLAGAARGGGPSGEQQAWWPSAMAVAVLGGASALVAIFRDAGPRYLFLALVGLGILALSVARVTTLVKTWRGPAAEGGGRFDPITLVWAAAAVAASLGIVFGWFSKRWEPSDDWSDVQRLVWVLVLAAVVVTLLGNWWMHWVGRFLAVVLTITTGLGTLAMTEHQAETPLGLDTRVWLFIALAIIGLVYLSDVVKVVRYTTDGAMRALAPAAAGLAVLLGLGLAASLRKYNIPLGAWSGLAVVAVGYAIAALATYFPVFARPKPIGETADPSHQSGQLQSSSATAA